MTTYKKEILLTLYRTMITIRKFEERVLEEVAKRPKFGPIHFSVGQEAVATGVCAHLKKDDYIASSHRPTAHAIAKGVSVQGLVLEFWGKADGTNRGKGGPMHVADLSVGMLGAYPVVGASVPVACGAALKAKLSGSGQVAVAFFGDGATGQGVIYECMNLASIWHLPILFVCENNLYANSTPVEYAIAGVNIADKASGFGMPGLTVDGMDVFSVYEKAGEAISEARKGKPALLECKTYRFLGHYFGDNPRNYRLKEEEDKWLKKDPIKRFKQRVIKDALLDEAAMSNVDKQVEDLVENAIREADKASFPQLRELLTDAYNDYPVEALKT